MAIEKNCNSPQLSWLARRIRAFSFIPYEGRFGTIINFLENIFPLQLPLQQLGPSRWDSDLDGQPKGDTEEWCDLNLVLRCLKGVWFWKYGLMVYCLAAGIEQVRNFSRGCVCHRPSLSREYDESPCVESYVKRLRRFQKETLLEKPCPAKGLVGPWLACGEHRTIMEKTYNTLYELLLNNLHGLCATDRQVILQEFDQGRAHASYTPN